MVLQGLLCLLGRILFDLRSRPGGSFPSFRSAVSRCRPLPPRPRSRRAVCQGPGVAAARYHKPRRPNNRNLSRSSGGRKATVEVSVEGVPSEAREGDSPAASGGLRAVFGLSRLAEASLQSLFLFTWPPPSVRFCIPVSFLSCHQSHQIRAHPSDLILVTYICNDCISKRGHSLRYWGLGLRHTDFGGNTTVLTPWVPPFLGVRSPT